MEASHDIITITRRAIKNGNSSAKTRAKTLSNDRIHIFFLTKNLQALNKNKLISKFLRYFSIKYMNVFIGNCVAYFFWVSFLKIKKKKLKLIYKLHENLLAKRVDTSLLWFIPLFEFNSLLVRIFYIFDFGSWKWTWYSFLYDEMSLGLLSWNIQEKLGIKIGWYIF